MVLGFYFYRASKHSWYVFALQRAESSWQFLRELHHEDIIGLQMCPTYTQGTQSWFLVPLLISLCLIFDRLWKVQRKMSNSCIFGWLNTFKTLNRGQIWSDAFLYQYQWQWLVLWCHLSTKGSTFADGTKINQSPEHSIALLFSATAPTPAFSNQVFCKKCPPPKYHVTLSNWWPIRHYQDRIALYMCNSVPFFSLKY